MIVFLKGNPENALKAEERADHRKFARSTKILFDGGEAPEEFLRKWSFGREARPLGRDFRTFFVPNQTLKNGRSVEITRADGFRFDPDAEARDVGGADEGLEREMEKLFGRSAMKSGARNGFDRHR